MVKSFDTMAGNTGYGLISTGSRKARSMVEWKRNLVAHGNAREEK